MMTKKIQRAITIVALGTALTACMDLDITNHNAPDRFRALAEPGDVEVLIYSAYRLWWQSAHHNQPNRAYSIMGNETTSALTGSAVYDVARNRVSDPEHRRISRVVGPAPPVGPAMAVRCRTLSTAFRRSGIIISASPSRSVTRWSM